MNDSFQMLKDRILKTWRLRRKWAKKEGIDCYRIYDWDIPQVPIYVDVYGEFLLVFELETNYSQTEEEREIRRKKFRETILSLPNIDPEKVIFKTRKIQDRQNQYEKLDESKRKFLVNEKNLKFWVNLYDYIDSGLFLDHRPFREILQKESNGKSVLNLFSYTGSLSVACAKGNAQSSESWDLSNTYLDWALENFETNELDLQKHKLVRTEILQRLSEKTIPERKFDILIIDPPILSRSKSMHQEFLVQEDHTWMLETLYENYLKPNGRLYFSTPFQKFKLIKWDKLDDSKITDLTKISTPVDFQYSKPHKLFLIQK